MYSKFNLLPASQNHENLWNRSIPSNPSIAFAVRDLLHLLSQKFWLSKQMPSKNTEISQPTQPSINWIVEMVYHTYTANYSLKNNSNMKLILIISVALLARAAAVQKACARQSQYNPSFIPRRHQVIAAFGNPKYYSNNFIRADKMTYFQKIN